MSKISPDKPPDDVSDRISLCLRIRTAFGGVLLGKGVGLKQAQGIDDHESEEVRQSLRQEDEKDDWHRITSENLNSCYSSLCFFDAEGMRFHLPAYLIAEINGDYEFDLMGEFIDLNDYKMEQFSLFTTEQRGAIAEYLRFIQDQPGHWLDVHKIDLALESFWDVDPEISEMKKA
jgi:hypothetical protein